MSNIYDNPEDFGLTMVGSFDWDEPYYDFDICAVWKDERGQFWVGNDSGCSCPEPFEDYTDVNGLDGPHTRASLESRLYSLIETHGQDSYGYPEARLRVEARRILDRI